RNAEDALVRADGSDGREADAVRHERKLEPRLSDHVVGGGRQRGPRRPAQDEAAVVAFEQKGEVGAAALADPGRADGTRPEAALVQERLDAVEDEERRARLRHHADWPPSTMIVCPVTKSEAAEARKTTAPFRSSGPPKRRSGMCSRYGSGFSSSRTLFMSVGNQPGAIAFTVMPCCAHLVAKSRVNETTPPFEAL